MVREELGPGCQIVTGQIPKSAKYLQDISNPLQVPIRRIQKAEADWGMSIVPQRRRKTPANLRITTFQEQSVVGMDGRSTPMQLRRPGSYLPSKLENRLPFMNRSPQRLESSRDTGTRLTKRSRVSS